MVEYTHSGSHKACIIFLLTVYGPSMATTARSFNGNYIQLNKQIIVLPRK